MDEVMLFMRELKDGAKQVMDGLSEAGEQKLWRETVSLTLSNGDSAEESIKGANAICDAYRARFPRTSDTIEQISQPME